MRGFTNGTEQGGHTLLGYELTASDAEATSAQIMEWIEQGDRCRWLACLNPHSYVSAKSDEAFKVALQKADWLVPDGIGIIMAARILGVPLNERLTGSDMFRAVNQRLNDQRGRVFLLGSTMSTLNLLQSRLREDYPQLIVSGVYSPPFKVAFDEQDNAEMLSAIRLAEADALWVGMTSPKQDLWIHQMQDRLPVRFAAGVGAVFDFYTGRIPRPSPAFQKLGLEWLPRLLREPRRLWRRMLVSAPLFILDVLKERTQRRRD